MLSALKARWRDLNVTFAFLTQIIGRLKPVDLEGHDRGPPEDEAPKPNVYMGSKLDELMLC